MHTSEIGATEEFLLLDRILEIVTVVPDRDEVGCIPRLGPGVDLIALEDMLDDRVTVAGESGEPRLDLIHDGTGGRVVDAPLREPA